MKKPNDKLEFYPDSRCRTNPFVRLEAVITILEN